MTTTTTTVPEASRWINLPVFQQGLQGGLPTGLVVALTNMMAGIALTPAQVAAAQGAQDTPIASWLGGGAQVVTPEAAAGEPSHFSTDTPTTALAHSQITLLLSQALGIPTSVAGDYVNQWAQTYWDASATPELGADGLPTGNMVDGTWPDLTLALQDPLFLTGASKIPTGASLFPSMFVIVEPDGSLTYMNNELSTGPYPIDVANAWHSISNQGANRDLGLADIMALPGGLPRYDRATFDAIIQTPSTTGGDGYGSEGSGSISFDRDEIIAGVNTAWQTLLMDLPGDPGAIADRYIAQATSFYGGGTGGQLDFGTWIRNQIRETSRYAALYRRKPEGMAEEDFLGAYQSTARQFGLRPETEQGQVEMGASTGVGQGDFARQIAGSREYQVGNLGAVSRQFASMFSQLGPIARS